MEWTNMKCFRDQSLVPSCSHPGLYMMNVHHKSKWSMESITMCHGCHGTYWSLLRLLAAESLTGVELSETCFDPLDPQKTQIIGWEIDMKYCWMHLYNICYWFYYIFVRNRVLTDFATFNHTTSLGPLFDPFSGVFQVVASTSVAGTAGAQRALGLTVELSWHLATWSIEIHLRILRPASAWLRLSYAAYSLRRQRRSLGRSLTCWGWEVVEPWLLQGSFWSLELE